MNEILKLEIYWRNPFSEAVSQIQFVINVNAEFQFHYTIHYTIYIWYIQRIIK